MSTTYHRTRGQLGCVGIKQKAGKKGFWKSGKVFSRVACVFYDGHLSDSTMDTSPAVRLSNSSIMLQGLQNRLDPKLLSEEKRKKLQKLYLANFWFSAETGALREAIL